MRISATGTLIESRFHRLKAHARAAGFSLVELLVVVAIIGLFAGVAVLSLSVVGGDRELQREALRLRSLLDALAEEAVLETRDYGVMFSQNGYRFYVYDYQRLNWLDPEGDYFLRERQFAEPLAVALLLEDREIALESELASTPAEQPEPQVLLLSTGEITPFEAQFYRDTNGGRYVLTGALNGALEVASDGFDGP